MAINWGLSQTPDFASAALGGYQAGQALQMQKARVALAERKAAREDAQAKRETERVAALGKVFGPVTPSAIAPGGTVDTSMPAQGGPMPSATPPEAGAAPPPAQPRQDGLQINWDALNQYAQLDPDGAQKIAQFAVTSSTAQLDLAKKRGETQARVAFYLKGLPQAQRAGALAQMGPQLTAAGFTPEEINAVQLDDATLDQHIAFGMTVTDMIAKADKDRAFAAAEAERARDNARADRADARAAVRFQERDKDRAALAASGGGRVRTDIDDLNY